MEASRKFSLVRGKSAAEFETAALCATVLPGSEPTRIETKPKRAARCAASSTHRPKSGKISSQCRHPGEIGLRVSDYQAVATPSFREGRFSFPVQLSTHSARFPIAASLAHNFGLPLRICR